MSDSPASGPYKLQVKIGNAEFNAEGPETSVKAQFDAFMEVLRQSGAAARGNESRSDSVTDSEVQRAFSSDDNGIVSLRVLPKTDRRDADALILLIWGFRQLQSLTDVSALDLAAAGRQSGLQIDRIDRVIAPNGQYVSKGGAKRGTRYALNNPGADYAKALLARLFS